MGFSPLVTINRATQTGPETLGHGKELGVLQVRKLADIQVVEGDVVQVISILEPRDQIIAVLHAGVSKSDQLALASPGNRWGRARSRRHSVTRSKRNNSRHRQTRSQLCDTLSPELQRKDRMPCRNLLDTLLRVTYYMLSPQTRKREFNQAASPPNESIEPMDALIT